MFAELAVTIVNQILAAILRQHAFIDIGDVSYDLCHPVLMRIRSDSRDMNFARTHMDEEEDVVRYQPRRVARSGTTLRW